MNSLILCLIFLALCTIAKGQRNYDEAMRQGDDAFSKRDYKTAINKYFAAEAFEPTKKDSVKAKVDSAFTAINDLRAEAEKARKEAVKAKLAANEQRKITLVSRLTTESETILIKNPSRIEESVLLALKSMEVNYTLETERVLRKSLALLPRRVFKLPHRGTITDICVSDDNRYLATASSEAVFVWDIEKGKEIFTLQPKSSISSKAVSITELSFSPNGEYLLIVTKDSSLQLINIRTQKIKFAFKADLKLNIIKFSLNGEFIAGIDNSNIRLGSQVIAWDAMTGIKKLHDTIPAIIRHLEADSEGNYLAIAMNRDTAELWDVYSRQKKTGLVIPQSELFAISSNRKFLWTTDRWGDIHKWDIASKREISRIRSVGPIQQISVSSDDQYITANSSNIARLWKTSDGSEVARFTHETQISRLAFINGSKLLVTASQNGVVKIWETQSADPLTNVYHQGSYLNNLLFSDDEKFLFANVGSTDDLITWNIPDNVKKVQRTHPRQMGHDARIRNIGHFLFLTSGDSLYKEDRTTGDLLIKTKLERIGLLEPRQLKFSSFSPDGRYLIEVFEERPLLWQIDSGCHLVDLKLPKNISNAEFSSTGSHLITISSVSDTLDVMDIFDLTIKKSINQLYSRSFPFFTFSRDVKHIAYPVLTKKIVTDTAIVMNFEDRVKITRIKFPEILASLALSPDGMYLLGGQSNGVASVFNVQSRKEVARVDYYDYEFSSVADPRSISITRVLFSPTKKYFVTAGDDRYVKLWLWQYEDLFNQACSCVSRNFTFDEWKKYFDETAYQLVCKNLPPHPSLRQGAKEKARSGDIDGALRILSFAIKLGDTLEMEPKKWVMQEAAIGALERGYQLAREGAIKEAVESYSKAQKLDPSIRISAAYWNTLAWQGAIRNQVALVKEYANLASEMDSTSGGYRDTRGLIRALTGDFKGAIEDFQFYLKWGKEKRRPQHRLEKRQKWIEDLRAGRNPFDSTTLEGLIYE
jgi:WD40 repeat protein